MMKITGLSHLFKWENLHNWWLTKYFFAPLYIINIHNTHTHILCRQKLSFWMRLIVIIHFTALFHINTHTYSIYFVQYIIYTGHTHILCKQKLLFWMQLIAICV